MKRLCLWGLLALSAASTLSGCVVVPAQRGYYVDGGYHHDYRYRDRDRGYYYRDGQRGDRAGSTWAP